jgi:hypothetical protein
MISKVVNLFTTDRASNTYDEAVFKQAVERIAKDPKLTSEEIVSQAFWIAAPDLLYAVAKIGKFDEADEEFRRTYANTFIRQLAADGYDVWCDEDDYDQ